MTKTAEPQQAQGAPLEDARALSPEVRSAVAEARLTRAQAEGIVRDYVILGSSLTLVPLPLLGTLLLFNLQLSLMGRLADHYAVPFDRFHRSLAASLLTAVLPVLGTSAGLSLLRLFPAFGPLVAGALLSRLAGVVSYATGTVLIEHFESGGTMADLSVRAFRRGFRKATRQGQAGVSELLAGTAN